MSVLYAVVCLTLRLKMSKFINNWNATIVLSLIILEFIACLNPSNAATSGLVLKEKQAHLDKISHLYKLLKDHGFTGESQNASRRFALVGSISDKLNLGLSPRDYYNIRNTYIDEFRENGQFSIYITVNSLSSGDEYFYLEGLMSEEDLDAKFIKVQRMNKQDYLKETLRQQKHKSLLFTTAINNGSKDINELISQCEQTVCTDNSTGVCGRGKVVIDNWLNTTLKFQRSLASDIPINFAQWIGTHNSFNNRADGYGKDDFLLAKFLNVVSKGEWDFVWAQQYFSITDQLNMGVRYLMLNPVYFWGTMRLCHCGGVNSKVIDNFLKYISNHLHITINYNTGDLGCVPSDRPFETALQEIQDWLSLPGHESEQVIIMVNDLRSDFNEEHKFLIWNSVSTIVRNIALTQTERNKHFPNVWPTPNQMKELGKNLIIFGTSRIMNDSIFQDVSVPSWDEDTMKYFTPYSKCGGYGPGQWYTMGGESQVVGNIYDGPVEEGLIVSENYPYVLQCPVSITKLDLVSPNLLHSAVWSWKQGYSIANVSNGQCAVMMAGGNGRWTTASCETTLCYQTCRNSSNFYQVSLSQAAAHWNATNTCPDQYEMTPPISGYQNWKLYNSMIQKNGACVWISSI